jgi:hypothetical protein
MATFADLFTARYLTGGSGVDFSSVRLHYRGVVVGRIPGEAVMQRPVLPIKSARYRLATVPACATAALAISRMVSSSTASPVSVTERSAPFLPAPRVRRPAAR